MKVLAADPKKRSEICETILRSLPDWFGIESAILDYIEKSKDESNPMFVVENDGRVVGFLLLVFHTSISAEVHVMGVMPNYHRSGIGRALIQEAELALRKKGVRYLLVKTLGPSRESPNYARTRLFYESQGFEAIEEIDGLWPGNPCLYMIKFIAIS